MPLRLIDITVRGVTPGLMRREHNALAKGAWEGTGYYWGEVLRPKHFQPSAFQEYGYKPREARYEKRKERTMGHTRPLVYTGESEARSADYRVRATGFGATVTMNVPALNYARKGWELRTITPDEAETLAEVWLKGYEAGLEKFRMLTWTVTVGAGF